MKMLTSKTYWTRIYMAGDIEQARQVCREYCFEVGLCVTITPTDYIYTGGEETGFVVGLVNYPRFPKEPAQIEELAWKLARKLRSKLCQHSFMIMTPEDSYWETYRED